MQAFDLSFGYCGAEHVDYLLLVKVCAAYEWCSDHISPLI